MPRRGLKAGQPRVGACLMGDVAVATLAPRTRKPRLICCFLGTALKLYRYHTARNPTRIVTPHSKLRNTQRGPRQQNRGSNTRTLVRSTWYTDVGHARKIESRSRNKPSRFFAHPLLIAFPNCTLVAHVGTASSRVISPA